MVKFKRVAEAFDEGARIRPCVEESSGSEHSADLSDLVNSFLERQITRERRESKENDDVDQQKDDDGDEIRLEPNSSNFELKDSLKKLLGLDQDDVKRSILSHAQMAFDDIGNCSSPEFKRRLMSRLRDRGLNAGLCKSRWDKKGRCIAGDYEYIDVNVDGNRYIIEVFLDEEFKIARPTDFYASLLQLFRPIYVGKIDELKQIVRLMCRAMKKSMKRVEIHVPPWRRNTYMQAKWFGSYKRTINEIPVGNGRLSGEDLSERRDVGFSPVTSPEIYFRCREDFGQRTGGRLGNLTAAMKDNGVLL